MQKKANLFIISNISEISLGYTSPWYNHTHTIFDQLTEKIDTLYWISIIKETKKLLIH